MMWTAALLLSLLLTLGSMRAAEAKLEEYYPTPTYVKVLTPIDPYTDSYCLNNGNPSTAQGEGSQKYFPVQSCSVGSIGFTGTDLNFCGIGGVWGSFVDLGTSLDLAATYESDSDPYMTLHLNLGDNKFYISGKGDYNLVALHDDAVAGLTTTSSACAIVPLEDKHIFLIRLTDEELDEPSTSFEDHSTLFAKLLVFNHVNLTVPGSTPALFVRWDVLAGPGIELNTDDAAMEKATTAYRLGVTCIVFIVLGAAGFIAYAVYRRYHPYRGDSLLN